MLAVKLALGSPQALSTWQLGTDPCAPVWTGVTCDANNIVMGIDLSGMPGIGTVNGVGNGSGTSAGGVFAELPFPAAMGQVRTLVTLNVGDGGYDGSLPSSWSTLTSLTHLSFDGDLNVVGSLPSAWTSLLALQSLDISNTGITGTLPASWSALASLSEIKSLNISG